MTALDSLIKFYDEIFVTRIGLRYVNELNAKNTQIETLDELLGIVNGDLTQFQALNKSWSLPKSAIKQLSLEDNGNELTIRFAFENLSDPIVILDFDYFVTFDDPQMIVKEDILERVENFHKGCYDAFRWSVKEDKMDTILNPEKGSDE